MTRNITAPDIRVFSSTHFCCVGSIEVSWMGFILWWGDWLFKEETGLDPDSLDGSLDIFPAIFLSTILKVWTTRTSVGSAW